MKCHRDGCDSAAEFHVGLELECLSDGQRQTLRAPTTIKVCASHAKTRLLTDYILSPTNKAEIARGLMGDGIPMPDFSSAEIVFVPIRAADNNWQAARESGTRH